MNKQETSAMIGVGLRHPHYQDALHSKDKIDFLEVHAENFFAEGGATLGILDAVRERYPISVHATALSLGSHIGVSQQHLQKLKRLVERIDPLFVSDHACFAAARFAEHTVHVGDLLPIAFNEASLATMVANIQLVQDTLKRPILIENLSAYLALPDQTMSETEFLIAACRQSGCRLLLDINNLHVNARNHMMDNGSTDQPLASVIGWINQVPAGLVGEIHLAGCTEVPQATIMVDDHSRPVHSEVWQAYQHALRKLGHVPTLIEWDTQLPDWATLVQEADTARAIANHVSQRGFAEAESL